MQTQINGIGNLFMNEYLSQIVLLPTLDKQKEISLKAKQLEFETRQNVDNAKLTVEHILFVEQRYEINKNYRLFNG